ncbi:MAG: hypothetical protein ACT4QC_00955 [Planctomycetaceae bacterium]
MDYVCWRNDVFGKAPGSHPASVDLLPETDALTADEALDHIDSALVDAEIHSLFSKEQIGIGLQLIYCNSCSNLPCSYVEAGDEARRVKAIGNLRYLYSGFFDKYCVAPVTDIEDYRDGQIGYLCYMLWDLFVLRPGNASPGMVEAALNVMTYALEFKNDNCIVSAIHGLGHRALDVPQAVDILNLWLQRPTTTNEAIYAYARQATTGCIQ